MSSTESPARPPFDVTAGILITACRSTFGEPRDARRCDLAALRRLFEASPASRVVSLSHLHAKVYVADEAAALVGSANLTRSGLDRNLEYGVLLDDPARARGGAWPTPAQPRTLVA